jgi:hypothetical protein
VTSDPTFQTEEELLAWDAKQCGILSWAQFAGPSAENNCRQMKNQILRVRRAHFHIVPQSDWHFA